jgi:hypothetical protein
MNLSMLFVFFALFFRFSVWQTQAPDVVLLAHFTETQPALIAEFDRLNAHRMQLGASQSKQ